MLFVLACSWHSPPVARQHCRSTIQARSAALITMCDDEQAAAFDETKYEAERLEKDAAAMQAMREEAEAEYKALRTPWKWVIRKRIWDYMEDNDIARQPRPVHHRIPNFDGAEEAAARLATLPEFEAASCVKVNPDTPQRCHLPDHTRLTAPARPHSPDRARQTTLV